MLLYVNYVILFLGAFAKLWEATVSFVILSTRLSSSYVSPSDLLEQLVSFWKDLHEVCYLSIFFKNLSRMCKFHSNQFQIRGTLYEYKYLFMIISHSGLLRMRNVFTNIVEKYFDMLLTVHYSNDQFWFQLVHHNFTLLTKSLYMFRAPTCPSSGGQTIHTPQLVQLHLL